MKIKEKDKYKLQDVSKVIDDVVKLIKKTHDIKQKVKWYNKYKGADIMKGSDCIPLKEKINEESWEFNNHGNGSDEPMIKMIVESVFSMGFQQGERYVRKDYDQIMEINKMLLEKLKKKTDDNN
jgi:hypothetical protein